MFNYINYFKAENFCEDRRIPIDNGVYFMNDTETCIAEIIEDPGIAVIDKVRLLGHYREYLTPELIASFIEIAWLIEDLKIYFANKDKGKNE